jgi:hypothetical protein
VTLLGALLIAGTLAATVESDDAATISRQLFPEALAAESRDDETTGGYAPRQLVDATTDQSWIFAAYSNGYSGSVRVIERTESGPRVVGDSTLANMAGTAPGVELRDLDADGTPEVLASFADQYGARTFWIYAWDGQALQLLSETANNAVTGVESNITEPLFLDTDGDGKIEIIDHKIIETRDDDGERSTESLYTVYVMSDGRLSPSTPALVVSQFNRGTGTPRRVETTFAVEHAGAFTLRLVNGTDAASAATSGNVWINNTSVLSPNDFKRSDRIVVRRISLTPGANTLSVQLNGAPGSSVWVLIEPSE